MPPNGGSSTPFASNQMLPTAPPSTPLAQRMPAPQPRESASPRRGHRRSASTAITSAEVLACPTVANLKQFAQEGRPVYLNVYDLCGQKSLWEVSWSNITQVMKALPNFAGLYHTGLEVDGLEHNYGSSGVWTCSQGAAGVAEGPGNVAGAQMKERILVGYTTVSQSHVLTVVSRLGEAWAGCYDQVGRNCNDFSDTLARELTGSGIPDWINRPARLGTAAGTMVGVGPTGRFSRADSDLPSTPAKALLSTPAKGAANSAAVAKGAAMPSASPLTPAPPPTPVPLSPSHSRSRSCSGLFDGW